jgi:hypothetical protein
MKARIAVGIAAGAAAILVAVDSKTSTVVDNIFRHTPPSQVLALSSRCHMSLPVAIGV